MGGGWSLDATILMTINWIEHVLKGPLWNKPSQTLAKCAVKEIGLSLEIVAGDSLGMGAMVASFQTWGTLPSLRDELKMSVTGILNSHANSLTSLLGSSSGPGDFLAFNLLSSLYMSQTWICGGGLEGKYAGKSSWLRGGLLLETEAKFWLMASAIAFSSLCEMPGADIRGECCFLLVINCE
jgi:hypothetical protein